MIFSHITNKEAIKQNILYPIGYSVITLLNGYRISKQSLCFTYRYDNIKHSSYEVMSHSYIKGCHICQLFRKDKTPIRQLQARINLNDRPLLRLSMDLKVMPRSHKGHRFILCIIDEVTNYLITVPIYHTRSEEIGDALIDNVISKYCIPKYIIMDQDSAFMSVLMNYLFKIGILRLRQLLCTIISHCKQSME